MHLSERGAEDRAKNELADNAPGQESNEVLYDDAVGAVEYGFDGAGVAGVYDAGTVGVHERSFGDTAVWVKLQIVALRGRGVDARVDDELGDGGFGVSQGAAIGDGVEGDFCAVSCNEGCSECFNVRSDVVRVSERGEGSAGV